MQKSKVYMSRTTAMVTAAAMVLTLSVPVLLNGIARASIPKDRNIVMGSSQASKTDVIYTVNFKTDPTGSASNTNGVVIEFCDNSPIIGDSTCTAPVGFDTKAAPGSPTLALGSLTGLTSLTIDNANSTANKLVLTGTNTSIAPNTTVSIPLGTGTGDGITNPSTGNHTFYARLLTFSTAGAAQAYTTSVPGTYLDAGGIALSTANQITITAKVQERLSFCVYDRTNCAAGTSGISLGNFNGVLDPAGPYVDKQAKFDISTNALSGATVVLKGDTLKSGSFSISAIGGTATASSAGSEQFGMCLFETTATGLDITSGTVGNSTYNDTNCSAQTTQTAGPSGTGTNAVGGAGTATFGFNTTNTTSTSGETIAKKPAGNTSTARLAFIGNIGNTTEAGIYSTTLTLIATGTY